jgi:hypothetical protein
MEGHKLISVSTHWRDTTRVEGYEQLYDLSADADEQHNLLTADAPLAAERASLLERLRAQLGTWKRIAEEGTQAHTPEDVRDRLRELGYL